MNSQNTPVHVRLWHRDFLLMSIANLLMSMSVYMLIPVLPEWLFATIHYSPVEVGVYMGMFGLGLYTFGPLCNFLVQRFRRNKVCMLSVIGMVACIATLYYVHGLRNHWTIARGVLLMQRYMLGAFFGLAQMVLSSTLIIDTSESFQRTEANHSSAWFSRFALSLGPMAGLVLYTFFGFDVVLLGAIIAAGASMVLILTVNIPFRSPQENVPLFSCDRFCMPEGMPLYLNLIIISVVVGLLMSLGLSDRFYALIMAGFLLALLAQRFVFRDADLKSEVVTGLILLLAALIMIYTHPLNVVWIVSPVFIGLAVGLIGSRFLLFFIKLSRHCQRGTSQSMYFLAWETGIALGVSLGFLVFFGQSDLLLIVSMALVAASLLLYNYYTHSWFMAHKNR